MPTQSDDQFLFPKYLDEGSRGSAVVAMQQMLCSIGINCTITGEHTGDSVLAVQILQRRLKFTGDAADCNFGPATRAALLEKYGINMNAIPARPDEITHFVAPEGKRGFWPQK